MLHYCDCTTVSLKSLIITMSKTCLLDSCVFLDSFESWFDIDSLSEAENVVAVEREQSILSMLHQVSHGTRCGGQSFIKSMEVTQGYPRSILHLVSRGQ